jgi:uncharacterized membrane protein YgcG
VGDMRQVPSSGERALRVAASAFALTVCTLAPAGAANAIGLPTSFAMSPSSGPVGTTVNVSGTGCTGLLSKSVAVTAATVPQTVIQPAVASNGSWHGSFSIPSATPAAPVAVGAVCVSDGLSLAYAPQTFTVTGAIVPPTTLPPVTLPTVPTLPTLPPTTLPTLPSVTPTTLSSNPSDPIDPGTSTPVSVPPDRIDNGSPGGSGGDGTSSNIGDGISSGTGGSSANGGAAEGGAASGNGGKSGTDARAAELNSPELSVARSKGSHGLAWLLWLLALSVPAGGVGFYLWMRRARRPHLPDPETELS